MKLILIAFIVCAVLYAGEKLGLLQISSSSSELKIDKTSTLVEEIKKISELTTVSYYEEMVLNEKKASKIVDNKAGSLVSKLLNKSKEELSSDEIVIIAKGTVRAGLDLSQICGNDIQPNGDTLRITLPQATILDAIINPSGFEIYEEDGTWSHEEVTDIESKAVDQLKKNAIEYGVLEKATSRGKDQLRQLFQTFGFSIVEFQ